MDNVNLGQSRPGTSFTGFGLSSGAGIGAVVGLLLSGNLALGLATGAAVGLLLGMFLDYDDRRRQIGAQKKQ